MPVRSLSKELQQKAADELHEVPDRIPEELKYIQNWLSTQPQLRSRRDEQWVLSFLRSCKFNYQRTKEKLELLAAQQTTVPEFYGNRNPFSDEVQEILKSGAFVILPQTVDPAGPKILFFRPGLCDPAKVPLKSLMKVLLMIMDILFLEDDNCAVAGLLCLVDLKYFSYKYFVQVTPHFVKNVFVSVFFAYPTRLKRACFFNCPWFFPIIYKMLKIFAPEKIKSRLHICNKLHDIYKNVPELILPKDYGGEEKSCDELAAELKLKMESYKNWYLEDTWYCNNQAKQIGKTKICEEIFNNEELRLQKH